MSEADRLKPDLEHRTSRGGVGGAAERRASVPVLSGHGSEVAGTPSWIEVLDELYGGGGQETPSDDEVDRLICELEGQFGSEQVAELLATCKDTVVENIVGPFGLGGVLAEYDKHGGRVLTRHNAKEYREGNKQIHVPEDARYNKEDYKHDPEVRKKKLEENRQPDGQQRDDYTGKPISREEAEVDHVVPKEQFHYDKGSFMLPMKARRDYANEPEGMAVTKKGINRSKGSKSVLEAKEAGGKAAEIDRRRSRSKERRAEEAVSRHGPSATQKARYYVRKEAPVAVSTGLRLGARQALGLCLHELTIGIFREVTDLCRNGLRDDEASYAEALWKRAAAVLRGVQAKWRQLLKAFGGGFVAGLLSEVATLMVNLFHTTSKRVIRIIREGFVSFLRAMVLVVSVPDGMTRYEALDAALKLMATAVLAACGFALEEVVENALKGWPLADLIVPVVLGIVVGLATVAVVFLLDQLDIFGVQEKRRRVFVLAELEARVEKAIASAELALGDSR